MTSSVVTPARATEPDLHLIQESPGSSIWWMHWERLVEDPSDFSINGAISDPGWTVVDHLGLGRPTLLVPPGPGHYAAGAAVNVQLFGTAPGDYTLEGSLVIAASGSRYYMDMQAFEETTLINPVRGGLAGVPFPSFNNHVFAPKMLDGSGQQIGFGWCLQTNGAPTDIQYGGARMWAHTMLEPPVELPPPPPEVPALALSAPDSAVIRM